MNPNAFTKEERVRKRKDYQRAYHYGFRIESKNFIVLVYDNETGFTRLGLTVTKKVGKAIKRNRIKRLLREFFRLNKSILPDSKDIIFIAKRKIALLTYQETCAELESLFRNKVKC